MRNYHVGDWVYDPSGIPKQVQEVYDDGVVLGNVFCHFSTVKPVDYSKPTLVFYCAKCGRPYLASAMLGLDGLAIWDLEDAIHNAANNGERMEIVYGDLNPLMNMCKCDNDEDSNET